MFLPQAVSVATCDHRRKWHLIYKSIYSLFLSRVATEDLVRAALPLAFFDASVPSGTAFPLPGLARFL